MGKCIPLRNAPDAVLYYNETYRENICDVKNLVNTFWSGIIDMTTSTF